MNVIQLFALISQGDHGLYGDSFSVETERFHSKCSVRNVLFDLLHLLTGRGLMSRVKDVDFSSHVK